MKKMLNEFKQFISRGNVMDLAVGVIIGGAFQAIISSLVSDVIMPIISLVTGGIDFSNWFIALDGQKYSTIAEATEAGAATINYGVFITAVIDFLLVALVVFFLVKGMNRLENNPFSKKKNTPEKPTTKVCPYCKSVINIEATRCPNCTSELK